MTDGTNRSEAFEPLDLLADANPVPAAEVARTSDPAAKAALFQEIIMSDPTSTLIPPSVDPGPGARRPGARRSGPRRWLVPLSAAAAVAVAVSAGLALVPRGGGNAAAALSEAAGETAGATSGQVTVVGTQVGGSEAGTFTMTTSYNDDDLETSFSFDGPGTAEDDLQPGRMRLVDGTVYYELADPGAPAGSAPVWYANDAEDARTAIADLALPADPTATGKGLVELVQAADDVERTGDNRYRATLTIGEIRSLAVVPAGLDLLVTDPPLGQPIPAGQEVVVTVEVDAAGYLSRIEATVSDTVVGTETEPVDVTIATTYSDLDQVGPIEAPADAQPAPKVELTPEEQAASNVMTDLFERRPDLCVDAIGTSDTAYVECLRAEGEPEAAAAFETLVAGAPGEG